MAEIKNSSAIENEPESAPVRLVSFRIDEQDYAIEAADTVEIIRLVAITSLPAAPPFIPGIINRRGEIIPMIDLRIRLNFEPKLYNLSTPIIVVRVGFRIVGLLVDKVTEVAVVPASDITDSSSAADTKYVRGVVKYDERLTLLIDLSDLLSGEEAELLDKALGSETPPDGGGDHVEEFDLTGLSRTG